MAVINLLGWLYLGIEAIKDKYNKSKIIHRNKNHARICDSPYYLDTCGKTRLINNGRKVYTDKVDNEEVLRDCTTGQIIVNLTQRYYNKMELDYKAKAEEIGKLGFPISLIERKCFNKEEGIEISTGRKFIIDRISPVHWANESSDFIYYPEEERGKQLTREIADKYRGMSLIQYDQSFNPKYWQKCYDWYKNEYDEKVEEREELEQAKQDALAYMKVIHGENYVKRTDSRDINDVFVYNVRWLYIGYDVWWYIYKEYYYRVKENYYPYIYWLKDCVDKKAWFVLRELIMEYMQSIFDKTENKYGEIYVVDLERDRRDNQTTEELFDNKQDADLNKENSLLPGEGVPLTFRIVVDKSFANHMLKFLDDEHYQEITKRSSLHKIQREKINESHKESILRGGRWDNLDTGNEIIIWKLLIGEEWYEGIIDGLVEYVKEKMGINPEWQKNYEKGLKLYNEQKKTKRYRENN